MAGDEFDPGSASTTGFATDEELAAHTDDASDAHDASAISYTPTGTIAATDVQAAVAEVATDASAALTTHQSDTTVVHGFTDTANVARINVAQTWTADQTLPGPTKVGAVGPSSKPGVAMGASLDVSLYRDAADVLRTDDAVVLAAKDTASLRSVVIGDDLGVVTADANCSVTLGATNAGSAPTLYIGNSSTEYVFLQWVESTARGRLGVAGGGLTILLATTDVLGFYGAAGSAKPTITGSRALPEQALANLLTALANLGLITNNTTV